MTEYFLVLGLVRVGVLTRLSCYLYWINSKGPLRERRETFARRRHQLRFLTEGTLSFFLSFFFLQRGLKQELTQCYKNQPTRDLLEYLLVFVCVARDNADPILSTGIRHHGDERREVAGAGDTVPPGLLCSSECNILQVSLSRSLSLFSLFLFFHINLSFTCGWNALGVISLTLPAL